VALAPVRHGEKERREVMLVPRPVKLFWLVRPKIPLMEVRKRRRVEIMIEVDNESRKNDQSKK
jgi:hypothetical protein